MNLSQALNINLELLRPDDLRALEHMDSRWQEYGRPVERQKLIDFLERAICELKDLGGYPAIALRRKKELQRRQFNVQHSIAKDGCSCIGGYLPNGTICPCPKGEPHRAQFRKWGMKI